MALERARQVHTTNVDENKKSTEYIFPELKESEDEKIKEEILELAKTVVLRGGTLCGKKGKRYDCKAWIAWLEKQGPKSINIDVESMVSSYKQRLKSQGAIENTPLLNLPLAAYRHGVENVLEELNLKKLEKQGDTPKKVTCTQEVEVGNGSIKALVTKEIPIDKVELKFKVGDWVVCQVTGSVYQIKNCIENLSNHKYGYDLTNGGYIGSDEVNHYHLWTIKDAKAGDVLAADECYVIFKEIDGLNIKCYCTYHYMGFNPSFYIDTLQNKTAFKPATKEQRDHLFEKIHEAGYEWYAEKKELKKI